MDSHAGREADENGNRRPVPSSDPAATPPRRRALKPADVAIVGMGAIMPGAPDLRRFWENILDKAGAITEVPAERWPVERYYDQDRGAADKIVSKWGGFLPETPFDPMRFGIPPAAVASIDPAQLLALVVAEAALNDAGLAEMAPELRRCTSVILGFTGGLGELGLQYAARAELARAMPNAPAETRDFLPEWTSDSFAGLLPNVVAGRIANRFDFGGSNFVVDAACATSLAALRQAVIELETGRSDIVLCGAVEAGQGPFAFTCFSKAHALSPTGACRAFDAAADGTAISEGIAMVVLRRLEDAEAAGDRIYAVIKGIDGSSDGRARGLMAPLPAGQQRALARAYDQAGYSPASVELFEAHGTGTVSGDASEIESLSTLLAEAGAAPRSCAVGSVKALIGHAEGAAGLAGLVKVALGLHHRILPPHAGVTEPNPALRRPDCPIALHQGARPWLPRPAAPRRAGVSAFGFGGTNYHVTLEEHAASAEVPPARTAWPVELFVWRATDRAGLAAAIGPARDALRGKTPPPLADVAAGLWKTLGAGHTALAIVAGSHEALANHLATAAERLATGAAAHPLPPGLHFSEAPLSADGKVAMLFSGQGSQYPDMGRELGTLFPDVARILAAADAILAQTPTYRDKSDPRLSRLVTPFDRFGEEEETAARAALAATDVAQPALGALEAAMLSLTARLGVAPSMVAGHSYGEYVALHAAGVLDLADLLRVSEARGRAIVGAVADGDLGTMAAVAADAATVRTALGSVTEVVVANLNGPAQTVVSGSRAAIAAAVERLGAARLATTPIPVSAAFHSPLMQPAQRPLVRFFDEVAWQAPRLPVYANTTGAPHAADAAGIRALLERHLTEPVDFIGMIEAMYAAGARVFLEIGPKTVLSSLTRRVLGARPHAAVALDGMGGGLAGLLHALAALMVQGVHVDLTPLFAGRVDATPARTPEPAVMGWLVNGSRARRAGGAVRTTAAPRSESVSASGLAPRPRRTTATKAKEVDMHGSHGPVGTDEDVDRQVSGADRAIIEHQRTMQQFLQTQERLMLAYLGGGAAGQAAAPIRPFSTPRPAPARSPMPTRPTPSTVAPHPAPAVPPPPRPPTPLATAPIPAPAPATPAATPTGDLKSQLLAIASDKTGYPEDMLSLDLNMEADLGIDSIKRVEILAAFRQSQPAAVSEFLQPRMTAISKAMSLQEILDRVGAALSEMNGAPRPFDLAGEEPKGAALSRYVMRAVPAPPPAAAPRLAAGLYLVLADSEGVTAALAPLFARSDATLVCLPADLADDAAIAVWLCSVRAEGPIRGLIALAPIATPDAGPRDAAAWRAGMARDVKALFPLLRLAARDLEDGLVAVVSAMGGRFGRDALERPGRAGAFAGAGGGVGLIKCLSMEWSRCRCVAIDLDPDADAAGAAAHIHAELAMPEGPLEVGFPRGVRTIFRTERAALPAAVTPLEKPGPDWIVVAVGGARGITAETLRPFATVGATLVILGRAPLPDAEDPATVPFADAAALRRHFLATGAAGGTRATPAQIEARIAGVLRDRETRANLADFTGMGAGIDYRVCDVRDEPDVARTLHDIYARHGRVDALLFGAGLIEDRLIVDKTRDSLDRVFDTKVDGAFFFARHLRADGLKFVALFTSVAGRYGNRGQTDYGAANEVLNRFAWQLQAQWGARTKVTAVNWGPWAGTTNGPGMLTPATARQFRERGLHLITPQEGRDFLWNELLFGPRDEVEVVAWELPWAEPDTQIQRAQSGATAERAVA